MNEKETDIDTYTDETYPILFKVVDEMCLSLFGPLPPRCNQQILRIFMPSYYALKCMRKFVDESHPVTIPPHYGVNREAFVRGYHVKLSEDFVCEVIINYIDNLSRGKLTRGPDMNFVKFVEMVCHTNVKEGRSRDPSLPWYVAMVRWDERLYDLKLELADKESDELKLIINRRFE